TVKRTIYKEDNSINVIDFTYDTMNRLVRTTEGTEVTEYFYDNAGNRFIKKTPEGDITLYLRHGQIAVAMDVEIKADQSEERGRVNRYVLSGDLLAGRVTTIVKADETREVKKSWYHLDHLNSTKCVTGENGEVEVNYTYRAFGEQLRRLDAAGNETDDTAKYSYGGKELDEGTELYYFNARYYDATIGRFINVDPIQDGSNWYVYCGNNPLNSVDPTGLSENWNELKEKYKFWQNAINVSTTVQTGAAIYTAVCGVGVLTTALAPEIVLTKIGTVILYIAAEAGGGLVLISEGAKAGFKNMQTEIENKLVNQLDDYRKDLIDKKDNLNMQLEDDNLTKKERMDIKKQMNEINQFVDELYVIDRQLTKEDIDDKLLDKAFKYAQDYDQMKTNRMLEKNKPKKFQQ
ncbi:MAG: hypothetical protein JXJ04_21910, partial [Spirochaetales bacterium]|nr:hypothetical protein [Spirochaetales bacterium]